MAIVNSYDSLPDGIFGNSVHFLSGPNVPQQHVVQLTDPKCHAGKLSISPCHRCTLW